MGVVMFLVEDGTINKVTNFAPKGGEWTHGDVLNTAETESQIQPEFHIEQEVMMSVHLTHTKVYFEYGGHQRYRWNTEETLCRSNTDPRGGVITDVHPGFMINQLTNPDIVIPPSPNIFGTAECKYCAFEEHMVMNPDGSIKRKFTRHNPPSGK